MRPAVLLIAVAAAGAVAAIGVDTASAGGGGGCHGLTEGRGTEVALEESCFKHGVLAVEPGTTVTWTNRDGFDHVVMGTGWGTMDQLGPGDRFSHRFDTPGAYPYTCFLHPTMNGVVMVGDGGDGSGAVLAATTAPATDDGTSTGALVATGTIGALAGAAALAGTRFARRVLRGADRRL